MEGKEHPKSCAGWLESRQRLSEQNRRAEEEKVINYSAFIEVERRAERDRADLSSAGRASFVALHSWIPNGRMCGGMMEWERKS